MSDTLHQRLARGDSVLMVNPNHVSPTLCVPNHLPMSDQAKAVLDILRAQIDELFATGRLPGISAPAEETRSP